MRQLLKLAFYWFSISRQSGCIKTNHSGHPGMDSRKTLLNHRDYFPVSLHSVNCRHLPAVRAVQGDWLSFSGLKKLEKIPRMHCSLPTIWSRRAAPNLYLDRQQATPANKAFSVMAELTSFSPPTQKSELPHGTGPTSDRPFANAGQSTFGKLHLKFLC